MKGGKKEFKLKASKLNNFPLCKKISLFDFLEESIEINT